jgi:hypothetical protein
MYIQTLGYTSNPCPKAPSTSNSPRNDISNHRSSIQHPSKRNQPNIRPPTRLQNRTSNRNPRQSAKTRNTISRTNPLPKILNITNSSNRNRCQRNRRSRPKPIQHTESRHGSRVTARRKPEPEDQRRASSCGDDDGVECPEAVCQVAGHYAPWHGAGVEERVHQVCGSGVETDVQCVRADVSVGDEYCEFDEIYRDRGCQELAV